ncbi:hypothetical protein PV08_04968 [Exophiala spinifera]|uniref:PITH domain-containing protein n=1 Tax=Exophiala spinifera TaxID=91928 RepID=A0A0D2BFJ2_9EURO|nr:uncharacterized protein PV08_04968 [Exophiala spinifera]KIW17773.1 hypothetical protein PV08_04968 [Exophiala spinifera]
MADDRIIYMVSTRQFSTALSSSPVVVAEFFDKNSISERIAPTYERIARRHSQPKKITFARIQVDHQSDIANSYGVTTTPTYMIFKNARRVGTLVDPRAEELEEFLKDVTDEFRTMETTEAGHSASDSPWYGAELPRGYVDVTDQVDFLGLELLNWDSSHGNARKLISKDKPSATPEAKADFVQSDTDEQLMLYIPFQSTLKIHSVHLTSLPDNTDDDESPSRPKLIKFYTNKPHILGFDEADGAPPTQEVTLTEKDWNPTTGTAKIDLRIVKFQNVSSVVIFIVESEGDNEKVRLDRIRIVGETGEKRDGKIEKVASDD